MNGTKIEWTDKTWNPITGCTKFSSGCQNCYAETMSKRLKAMGVKKYQKGFDVVLHEECLSEPLKWKSSHNIFVNSMSDLFHEKVPFSFIDKIFDIIIKTPQHRYQVLTKRSEILAEYFKQRTIPSNVWLGVTVESKDTKYRIDHLRNLNANIKFLSCEPLLEDLGELDLKGINWVIVGGESGNKARPMKEDWVSNILNQCNDQGISFFFKQWGTWGSDGIKRNKKANGHKLKGKVIQEFPI